MKYIMQYNKITQKLTRQTWTKQTKNKENMQEKAKETEMHLFTHSEIPWKH